MSCSISRETVQMRRCCGDRAGGWDPLRSLHGCPWPWAGQGMHGRGARAQEPTVGAPWCYRSSKKLSPGKKKLAKSKPWPWHVSVFWGESIGSNGLSFGLQSKRRSPARASGTWLFLAPAKTMMTRELDSRICFNLCQDPRAGASGFTSERSPAAVYFGLLWRG